MEVSYIDQVECLPAIANYEREINLIESWNFSYPILVGVAIVVFFDFSDNLPVVYYKKISCTHVHKHLIAAILYQRSHIFIEYEY